MGQDLLICFSYSLIAQIKSRRASWAFFSVLGRRISDILIKCKAEFNLSLQFEYVFPMFKHIKNTLMSITVALIDINKDG